MFYNIFYYAVFSEREKIYKRIAIFPMIKYILTQNVASLISSPGPSLAKRVRVYAVTQDNAL